MRLLLPLFLLAGSVAAETVRFRTDDGIEIVADYFAVKKAGSPAVICVPMFRNVRATYQPLVGPLLGKGIAVLVIDSRGHGESAPELAPRVAGRDAALFNAMHADVLAGARFLESKGCDATRLGVVGASVGCSIAIDFAVRHPELARAAVVLTPGSNYLGVPTLDHLDRWPGTRIFTFVSSEEEERSREVIAKLRPADGSNHMVVPGSGMHGTHMFGKVKAIEELIANFMESSITKGADLRVPHWPAGSDAATQPGFFRRTLRPRRKVGETTYSLMAYAIGDTWTLGALVDRPFRGRVRFTLDEKTIEIPFDTEAKGEHAPVGEIQVSQASFRGTSWVLFEREKLPAGVPVVVEFRSGRGKPVRLPAAGRFRATLHGAK